MSLRNCPARRADCFASEGHSTGQLLQALITCANHGKHVTLANVGHVPAVTKHDKSGNQQTHADSTLVPQSELQSILHEYKDCFPEVLPDG